ncbi:Dihydrofolate synthase @ Folylpolyglutamate synthase [hydrothermal vent metagenome]|uniref:Dihydrofolate synthase @ Folylpolyglutamate synthase n=1 Tax=hydrothermal vent metagenome TaxID=652676 RepID=A0A3B0W984_9ZZZZ
MSYQEAWSFLDQLQLFKIKLGLDSMGRFLEALGNPHHRLPCIHIAGTNGKGSVGAALLSILSQAGYKVGFYTSPHLSSVRERFRIGDEYISEHEFAAIATHIKETLNDDRITYFEFTTAMAMLWFAGRHVDLAILEVGLGGRLDATNVVTPQVSVITNVSMDHEQHLGRTLKKIAAEKAGIIKAGVPVVSGVADDDSLRTVAAACENLQSPLYLLGRDFSATPDPGGTSLWSYTGLSPAGAAKRRVRTGLPIAMKGDYQLGNAAMALATLELVQTTLPVGEDDIREGLRCFRWPGRLEEFWRDRQGRIWPTAAGGKNGRCHFLLDGAHNPAGAQTLGKALRNDFSFDRLVLVWAAMADKDLSSTLLEIAPLADMIIFTRPESNRSALPDQLRQLLPPELAKQSVCTATVDEALELAEKKAADRDLICVAGSLYLVGRARQMLCGELVNNS